MIKRLYIPILLILFVLTPSAHAIEQGPKETVESFFHMIQKGRIGEAYDMLFKGSRIPASKPQAVQLLKTQTASGLPLYGKILGFERIRDEKIGTSVIRLVYLLKSELAPTVWEFYFYKTKSNWFLASIKFNDQFQLLDAKQ